MRKPSRWSGRARCTLAFGLLLSLAACGEKGGSAKPVTGGTAVFGELVEPSKPNPLMWDSDLDADLVDIMYMGLTRAQWENGRLVFLTADRSPMALATRYEYLPPDSTAIRFHMRPARWSDGQPITARDVAWTYRMLMDPRVASPRQRDAAQIEQVVAENDSTVLFRFRRRYPDMVFNASIHVAPEHTYAGFDPAQLRTHPAMVHPEGGRMVVSGPFLVEGWRHGQDMTLAPNPHFAPKPRLDRIVIRTLKDPTTRVTELKLGHLDFMRPIAFDQLAELRRQAPNVRIARQEKRYFEYLAWNPAAVPALADPEIRRALSMSVNVPYIIGALKMQDYAVPAAGPYPPFFAVHDTAKVRPVRYDPEGAKRIFEAKGWRDSDGDGIRDKGGAPLRITLLTNSGNQRRADASQIIQQELKQVGVDLQIQTYDYGTVSDHLQKHQFEAAMGSWGVQLSPDFTALWMPGQPLNIVSFDDPEATRLMKEALEQPTEQRAAPFWSRAEERIVQAQPYTFLYFYDQLFAVGPRMHGMRIDVYGPYQNAWEWWVSPDEKQPSGS